MDKLKAIGERWLEWITQHEIATVVLVSAITSICLNILLLIWLKE